MLELPTAVDRSTLDALDGFTQSINSIALSRPEANVILYAPDCTKATESNPASSLVNNAIAYSFPFEPIKEDLDSSITLSGYENNDIEDLLISFFETDHHWTIFGVYKAYIDIAEALGINPETSIEAIEYNYQSYGSIARHGLRLAGNGHIVDYLFDRQEYRVFVNGKDHSKDGRQSYSEGSISPELAKYQIL